MEASIALGDLADVCRVLAYRVFDEGDRGRRRPQLREMTGLAIDSTRSNRRKILQPDPRERLPLLD
jgi:hypothetical protein